MNIQNIAGDYKNINKLIFKSGYHNNRLLHNISGITCACCGRDVINLDNISKTFSRAARPLSEMMHLKLIDRWHDVSHLWGILEYLAKKYPNDSLDKILQNSDNNYTNIRKTIAIDVRSQYIGEPYYKVESLAKRVYKTLIYDSRQELKSSHNVIRNFKKYKKYLDGSPLKAFERLQKYSRKYPDNTLAEIVAKDEVYNYHKARNDAIINEYYDKLDLHFANILKLIKAEDPLSVIHFKKIENNAKNIIKNEKDAEARIPRLKDFYINNLKRFNCENIKDAVIAEIEQIPKRYDTESAFFVTAHDENWADGNIIKNIFSPFCGTVNHIFALSKGGVSNIYNTVVTCQRCNYAQNNKEISSHLVHHPDMPKNLEKQVRFVSEKILNREIPTEALVRWPIFLPANLNYYTGGKVKIDISEYAKKALELTRKKRDENVERINILKNRNEELVRLREELGCEIDEAEKINDEIDKNYDEIEKISSWLLKNDKDLDFFSREDLENYYYGSEGQRRLE